MNTFDKTTFETTKLNQYIKFYNTEKIPESDKGNFVYMFVDKEDRILYVGKTKNIKSRVDTHLRERKKDDWNKKIHRIFFLENITVADMNTLETYLIGLLNPVNNADGKTNSNHSFNVEIPIFSQVSLDHHYNLFFKTSRDTYFIRGNKINLQKFLEKKGSFIINYNPFFGNKINGSNVLVTKSYHNPFSTPDDVVEELFNRLIKDGLEESYWKNHKKNGYLYTKIEMHNYTAETLHDIREHFALDLNTKETFQLNIKETNENLFIIRPSDYFYSFYIYLNVSIFLKYFEDNRIKNKCVC
jgi:hypothetical protein